MKITSRDINATQKSVCKYSLKNIHLSIQQVFFNIVKIEKEDDEHSSQTT